MYCGPKTCYEVLGVTRLADKREISKAFRTLSLIHHPDRGGGGGGEADDKDMTFIALSQAYDVLNDEVVSISIVHAYNYFRGRLMRLMYLTFITYTVPRHL